MFNAATNRFKFIYNMNKTLIVSYCGTKTLKDDEILAEIKEEVTSFAKKSEVLEENLHKMKGKSIRLFELLDENLIDPHNDL